MTGPRSLALAAVLALAAGCADQGGTLSVTLATAPGSHVLDAAQTLKLVLTNPHTVVTAQRGSKGFDLSIDIAAQDSTGSLIVDALDANGTLIATGASPPFAIGGIDAKVVIYMAPPDSVAEAPVALPSGLTGAATGLLGYGVVFAGGRDAGGVTSDAVTIYNAYDHALSTGKPLPAPRSHLALGVGANGIVYLFGGLDANGVPTDTLWRFDTTVAPAGSYTDFGEKSGFARAGEHAVALGGDQFLLTGTPAAELTGLQGSLAARTEVPSLPAAGASVIASDGVTTSLFAGSGGVVRFRNNMFDTPAVAGAARAAAGVVALPAGKLAIACDGPDGVRVDAATAASDPMPGIPGVTKTGCAIAATSRHLLIAGGTLAGGGIDPTVQIWDAQTLAPVATTTLVVPRTGAIALPLPNDQILIAGGVDASGVPIATIELFTPPPIE